MGAGLTISTFQIGSPEVGSVDASESTQAVQVLITCFTSGISLCKCRMEGATGSDYKDDA